MLLGARDLLGSPFCARSGAVGRVSDILIDDRDWNIRWFVLELGRWPFGREVLLPPRLAAVSECFRGLQTDLGLSEVERLVGAGFDPPVHRQREAEIASQGELTICSPGCYGMVYVPPRVAYLALCPDTPCARLDNAGDAHLHSAEEIRGYEARTPCERLGKLHDWIIDGRGWRVDSAIVDLGQWWWPGQRVRIAPRCIGDIDWLNQRISLVDSKERLLDRNQPTRASNLLDTAPAAALAIQSAA